MNFPLLFFTIFLTTTGAVSAIPAPQPIVGGGHSMNRFRSIFRIKENFFNTLLNEARLATNIWCTGSFISTNAIITAAHCWQTNGQVELELTRSGGTTYTSPASVHIHPRFNLTTLQNDLAILILAKRLAPIDPLEIDGRYVPCNTRLQVYGFGRTTEEVPNFFQALGHSLFSEAELREMPTIVTGCSDIKIVTERSGATGCFGDSGGPLLRDGRLVGIASHIATTKVNYCTKGYPNYAMRLSLYLDWIRGLVPNVIIKF